MVSLSDQTQFFSKQARLMYTCYNIDNINIFHNVIRTALELHMFFSKIRTICFNHFNAITV